MSNLDDHDIAEQLRDILSGSEFAAAGSDVLEAWLERLSEALVEMTWAMGTHGRWVLQAVALACLIALMVGVGRLWRRASGPAARRHVALADPGRHRSHDPRTSPRQLSLRAAALARDGRPREAARTLQQAVWVYHSRRQGLAWREARADWEWAALLQAPRPLVELTLALQTVAFGGPARREALDECLQRAANLMQVDRGIGGPGGRA